VQQRAFEAVVLLTIMSPFKGNPNCVKKMSQLKVWMNLLTH